MERPEIKNIKNNMKNYLYILITIIITGLVISNYVFSITTKTGQFNDYDYMWPSATGTSGQVMKTDGAGTLSWANDDSSPGSDPFKWIASGAVLTASSTYNLVQVFGTVSSTELRSPSSTLGVGIVTVSSTSANDSNNKGVQTLCPTGTVVIGGGGRIPTANTDIHLSDSFPSGTTAWYAAANEGDAVAGNWTVQAFALCARLGG